jgi:hypothetical protein
MNKDALKASQTNTAEIISTKHEIISTKHEIISTKHEIIST